MHRSLCRQSKPMFLNLNLNVILVWKEMPIYKRPDIIISFLSPNNVPLTSERLFSLKNKLPSINWNNNFTLTHMVLRKCLKCQNVCHTVLVIRQSQWPCSVCGSHSLTPGYTISSSFFCSSVCDKANSLVNFSCIQGAYDKTAKCKSNLWQSSWL